MKLLFWHRALDAVAKSTIQMSGQSSAWNKFGFLLYEDLNGNQGEVVLCHFLVLFIFSFQKPVLASEKLCLPGIAAATTHGDRNQMQCMGRFGKVPLISAALQHLIAKLKVHILPYQDMCPRFLSYFSFIKKGKPRI